VNHLPVQFYNRRLHLLGMLYALMVLAVPALNADYYFYGVAQEDFINDNDTLWEALEPYPEWDQSRCTLRDDWSVWDAERGDGRDTLYDDLLWYGDNLQSDDIFIFSYSGHGGWDLPDVFSLYNDEGTTTRPNPYNDPTPPNGPPYAGDEWIPDPHDPFVGLEDDYLTDAFANFNSGIEVIVLSGACHAGGWVGGSHDLDTSAPADNYGLYCILGAPEQGTGIGVGPSGGPYEILLTTSLANTLDPYMTMSQWYGAAMLYGEQASYSLMRSWDSSLQDYYYWPSGDWVPSTYEDTYYTDHWGWEEAYLQLRPEVYSTLDTGHDNEICTPEPATTALFTLGLLGLGAKLRRRNT